MRTKRNKSKKAGDKKNFPKFIVPVLGVAILGVIVYLLLQPKPLPPSSEDFTPQKPVEAVNKGIKATIFIDNSLSMEGYAKANNNNTYLEVLSDLRAFYTNTNARVGDAEIEGSRLIDALRRDQIKYSNASFLHKDLKVIVDTVQKASKNKQHLLYFYVTDGIMSGSNKDIQEDSVYNKIQAQTAQSNIRDAFSTQDGSIGVSVYHFVSPFLGRYWTFDNTPISLNNTPRNFFVIAVGSRETLADFKQKVDSVQSVKGSKFCPKNQWHAIDDKPVSDYLNVGPNGAVTQEGKSNVYLYNSKVIRNSKKQEGNINFNLDAKALTNHSLNMDSLAFYSIVKVDDKILLDKEGKKIRVNWDESKHCFTFDVHVDHLGTKSDVSLMIPRLEVNWIDSISTEDDKTDMLNEIMRSNNLTFNFDKFMQGIRTGIRGATSEYIYQRTVTLQQQ